MQPSVASSQTSRYPLNIHHPPSTSQRVHIDPRLIDNEGWSADRLLVDLK